MSAVPRDTGLMIAATKGYLPYQLSTDITRLALAEAKVTDYFLIYDKLPVVLGTEGTS